MFTFTTTDILNVLWFGSVFVLFALVWINVFRENRDRDHIEQILSEKDAYLNLTTRVLTTLSEQDSKQALRIPGAATEKSKRTTFGRGRVKRRHHG